MNSFKTLPLLILAVSLSGCDRMPFLRGQQSAEPPQRQVPVGRPVVTNFWLYGIDMGCSLPSGRFVQFKFRPKSSEVIRDNVKVAATVSRLPGKLDFIVDTAANERYEFQVAGKESVREANILRFSTGGKPVLCFPFVAGRYPFSDVSLPQSQMIIGNWQCSGQLGSFALDANGGFKFGNGATGQAVLSIPDRSRIHLSQLFLLAGATDKGTVQSVTTLTANLSGLNQSKLSLGTEACTKQQG